MANVTRVVRTITRLVREITEIDELTSWDDNASTFLIDTLDQEGITISEESQHGLEREGRESR